MTGASLAATTGVTIQGVAIQPNGAFAPGPATTLQTSGSQISCYVAPLSAVLIEVAAPSAPPLTIVSSASASGLVAPVSLATGYGVGLASSLSLIDSAGVTHSVTTIYVSPSQINFEIPAGISVGAATVNIGSQAAALQVSAVAPGLFTLNGAGLAAANLVRVGPGNVQTAEPVFTGSGGSVMAVPISLGPSSDQFYLTLYGTGIRGAGGNVTVTINGINAPVTFAGAQGAVDGLDQVNVLLPQQLAGSGTVKVVLTANGSLANVVSVEFA
jgi:uncharacterized protein (TIGR03437 family)